MRFHCHGAILSDVGAYSRFYRLGAAFSHRIESRSGNKAGQEFRALIVTSPHLLRAHARAIWQAGVAAVRPEELVQDAVKNRDFGLAGALADCREIVVVGGGKAGAGMSRGLEAALVSRLTCVRGIVNVPAQSVSPLRAIRLHPARPAGTNEPTLEGVAGSEEMLRQISAARPD
jgi:glycerate-2-kinase